MYPDTEAGEQVQITDVQPTDIVVDPKEIKLGLLSPPQTRNERGTVAAQIKTKPGSAAHPTTTREDKRLGKGQHQQTDLEHALIAKMYQPRLSVKTLPTVAVAYQCNATIFNSPGGELK